MDRQKAIAVLPENFRGLVKDIITEQLGYFIVTHILEGPCCLAESDPSVSKREEEQRAASERRDELRKTLEAGRTILVHQWINWCLEELLTILDRFWQEEGYQVDQKLINQSVSLHDLIAERVRNRFQAELLGTWFDDCLVKGEIAFLVDEDLRFEFRKLWRLKWKAFSWEVHCIFAHNHMSESLYEKQAEARQKHLDQAESTTKTMAWSRVVNPETLAEVLDAVVMPLFSREWPALQDGVLRWMRDRPSASETQIIIELSQKLGELMEKRGTPSEERLINAANEVLRRGEVSSAMEVAGMIRRAGG